MKISKSVLSNKELTKKIYERELKKSLVFMEEIFPGFTELKFTEYQKNIEESYFFASFNYNNREISVSFQFVEKKNMIEPELKISDSFTESINKSFKDKYEFLIFLEEKLQLTLIPLDLEEIVDNEIFISANEWEVIIKNNQEEYCFNCRKNYIKKDYYYKIILD